MTFEEILDQAIAMLQRRGRVTYRTLQRQFQLDDAALDDVKHELIEGQRVAVDERDTVLVWTGDRASALSPTGEPAPSPRPARVDAPALRASTSSQQGTSSPPSSPILAGERRQVTVLFADISGFTALAETMDPEDVRQVMNACFAQLVPVVETYGGTIDKFIGDEIMALFGAPMAHDNDAERAVRAALAMQAALVAFNTAQGTTLGLHCGLNTGLVIAGGIGTPSRQDYSVMGDAVNLAARLEDASERGQIFVGPETYHLTRTLFRYEPLAPMALKGKTDPVQVYQVLGLQDMPESQETAAAAGLPLVGRSSELTLLLDRWAQATQGMGHVVVLSGEAGIGKSHLAAALGERVVQEGNLRLTIRCSPYHIHSALYPIRAHLERLLHGPGAESATAKVERLELLLRPTGLPLEPVVPLLAALVSIPLPEERYTPLHLSPQQQKQQTLEALVTWLVAAATRQPILSVWEDLHWADPSTLELLELLLRQVPTAHMLLVVTCRPPFQPPWGIRSYLTSLMLSRLGQLQVEQLVTHVTTGKALPPEVMRQVMVKTDGVPLFVEECVKMVLESFLVREEEEQYVLTGPLPPLAIPPTLQETLMARLDHLAPGKTVAQVGATVGRDFAYTLLAAVAPLDATVVQQGLSQLVEAELLYQRGHLPQAQYRFKHALIQEIAYQSLLKSPRQHYHQRIAQALEEQFTETTEAQPELLAYHCTEAGLIEQAIGYWQKAGQSAVQRSAHVEAIAHLRQGLELLKTLPKTSKRTQCEVDMLIALGASLLAVQGYAASEVGETYTHARLLCEHLDDPHQIFPVLRGLWNYYLVRAEYQTAQPLGAQLLTLAQHTQDSAMLLAAHRALGTTLLWLGEVALAHAHFTQSIALYDPQQHRTSAFLYGEDAGVICHIYAAWTLWYLGYPDQALARCQEAVALAQQMAHPFSLGFALFFAALLHQFRREVRLTQERAEAAVSLATEQGFPHWRAEGSILRGWALAQQGRAQEGIKQLHQGLMAWRATGAEEGRPYFLALLAKAHGIMRQPEAGLAVLTEALTLMDTTDERVWEPELYRLKGEFFLQQSLDNQAEAESCFNHAIHMAQSQQAKSWELRATTSLARLWQQQGKRQEAHDLLAPVYGWFTEGFDTADLQEAKALLDALA
jgi:class 3 adenylate cyclase/predicted ATPase